MSDENKWAWQPVANVSYARSSWMTSGSQLIATITVRGLSADTNTGFEWRGRITGAGVRLRDSDQCIDLDVGCIGTGASEIEAKLRAEAWADAVSSRLVLVWHVDH